MYKVFVDQVELNRNKPDSEKRPIIIQHPLKDLQERAREVEITSDCKVVFVPEGVRLGTDTVRVFIECYDFSIVE